MKDIANKAGVSVATASIVLNGKNQKRITKETISNVLKVAEELHYRPDVSAQMLKGKGSSTIGLVIPDISNPFYPEMTKGITDRAWELGYNVILFNTDNDIQKEKFAFDTLIAMRVAGIIVCGVYDPGDQERELFRQLQDARIPVVQVDRYDSQETIPYVAIDNFGAAKQMVDLLMEMNHQRIAVITADMHLHIINERLRGYINALAAHGVVPDERLIIQTHIPEMQKVNAKGVVQQLIDTNCTAVLFLLGDMAAIECIEELRRRGLRVPEDISVAGFDGIQAAGVGDLTTVQQPKYEMGQTSVELLLSRFQSQNKTTENIILSHNIVQRGSVCRHIGG